MNRLKYSIVYLVGSMDDGREEGRKWREDLTNWLEAQNIIVLDPYKKPLLSENDEEDIRLEDDRAWEANLEHMEHRDYDALTKSMKSVRATDLRMTDKADFLIVNYDVNKRLCGTIEEIVTANRQKKPIIIKCEDKSKLPFWLFGMIPHELFFETWEDVCKWIFL